MMDAVQAKAEDEVMAEAPRAVSPEQLARWKGEAEEFVGLLGRLPRGGCQLGRWHEILDDARRFIEAGWIDRAKDLGWTRNDLWGVDVIEPWGRADHAELIVSLAGLIVSLDGGTVQGLSKKSALITTKAGERKTLRRLSTVEGVDPFRITGLDQLPS